MGTQRGPVEDCDTLVQPIEIAIESGEHAQILRVGGEVFHPRESLPARFGFKEGVILTDRLLRILAFLALRRRGTSSGWTDAVEIALLVESSGTDRGVKKFLEMRRRIRFFESLPEVVGFLAQLA